MQQLPPPACTTDVYLAALIERMDALTEALTVQREQPQQPARRRAVKESGRG